MKSHGGAVHNEAVEAGLNRFPFFIQHHQFIKKTTYHTQPGIEIDITHEGRGTLVAGHASEVLLPRQVVIFSGTLPHRITTDEAMPYRRSVICIVPDRFPYGNPALINAVNEAHRSWRLEPHLYRTIDRLCTELNAEMKEARSEWEAAASAVLIQILVLLRRSVHATDLQLHDLPALRGGGDLVQACRDHIRAHLDASLSLSSLAALFYVSPGHLARRFRRETGMTVHQYILSERMTEAKRLIATQKELSITDVALRVGFQSLSHFSRAFHHEVGKSPLAYRRSVDFA